MLTSNTVIEGDCTRVLRTLPSECVDAVVTDPPYFVRYTDRSRRTIANDDDPNSVLGAFTDVYRLLKNDTFCISFYGWNRSMLFFRLGAEPGLSRSVTWCGTKIMLRVAVSCAPDTSKRIFWRKVDPCRQRAHS